MDDDKTDGFNSPAIADLAGIFSAHAEDGVMTFRFCLMGASQQPLVDVRVASLAELHEMLDRQRFVVGHLADADEHGVQPGVLIATSRVQMVVEAD